MAAAGGFDIGQFEQIILALLSPDNNLRNQAEEALRQAKQNPEILLPAYVQLLRTNQNPQVRSMCAVLLRKSVMQAGTSEAGEASSSLARLSVQTKQVVKSELLACIQGETERHIRKKICDADGQLGVNVLTENIADWPELMPFMLEATRSGNPSMHEAALIIFSALSEFIAEKLKAHHPTLLDVFRLSLQTEQQMPVRNAALKALASFLLAVELKAERQPFQELVPAMLQTIADALTASEEEQCRDALEVFVEIAESQPTFLKKHVQGCVTGMINIASNLELEDSTRHLALEFLLTVAEQTPTVARKLTGFCAAVVPVALQMMLDVEGDTAEELQEWEEEDDDDEKTDITNYDVGEEALDRISIALGGKTMVPVLFSKIQEMFKSADWKQRHAALMAISQSGEGCEQQMEKDLENIVGMIVQNFADAHPRVRWAAINTVGQMSTDFGPGLQTKLHGVVLPALVTVMDDGCNRVQAHAAAAVINFCEHCDRTILKPYLQGLLTKLHGLLLRDVRRVQEQAVTAVASVADVAEDYFAPFYDAFMPGLKGLLQSAQGKDHRMLRGKAMECISLIGVAVGKERFGPDAKEVMEILITTQTSALEPDDPQVSFLLQACARICKCLGGDFKPYLPFVIPPLLDSAQIDPELHVTDADEDDGAGEEEGMESVTVAIRGQGNKRITIRTSALEEKATACSMLHSYASELKGGFLPYVQEVARILVPLIKFHYMDDVRTASMMAMPELLQSAVIALQEGEPGASVVLIQQLKDFMFAPIMQQLEKEPDVETLTCMLQSVSEVISQGEVPTPEEGADPNAAAAAAAAALTPPQQQQCTQVLCKLVTESVERRAERAKAQEEEEPDEEEEEQIAGEAEREEILISNVVECVGTFMKAHHSAYLPIFEEQMAQIVMAMLQPSAIDSDRSAALCVFDDLIEHCSVDGGAERYIASLLPFYLQYSQDANTEVRQAAVYGIGVLAEFGKAFLGEAEQQQCAQAMIQVMEAPEAWFEDNATASDNAVSALGKLCKLSDNIAAAAFPRWLKVLPLSADKSEAILVHGQLAAFVEASNVHLLGAQHERLPEIIIVFGQILGTDAIDEELTTRVVHLLKQVHQGLPHILQGLPTHPSFAKLDEVQRKALEAAISG